MTGIIGSGMIVTINVLISLVIGGCLAIKLIEKQNRILEVRIWAVPWRDCLFWWGYLKFSFCTKSHGRSSCLGGSMLFIFCTKSHGRSSCLGGEYAIYFSYKVVWGDVHTPEEDTINFSYKVVQCSVHTPRFSIICNYIIDYVSYNFSFC